MDILERLVREKKVEKVLMVWSRFNDAVRNEPK